jgi:hypothetical protein
MYIMSNNSFVRYDIRPVILVVFHSRIFNTQAVEIKLEIIFLLKVNHA